MDPKPSDVLTKAAREKIEKAIAGRDLAGFTAVNPADVLAVAATLPKDKSTPQVKALMMGAAGAGNAEEVFQSTAALAHLLEQVG